MRVVRSSLSLVLFSLTCCTAAGLHGASPWTIARPDASRERAAASRATRSCILQLDREALRTQLARASRRGVPSEPGANAVVIELPTPQGTLQRFALEETQILHPDLQARYPHIRTYTGRGLDDAGASAQIDDTDHGIRVQVLCREGTWLVEPLRAAGVGVYQSLALNDALRPKEDWSCQVGLVSERHMFRELRAKPLPALEANVPTGAVRRTFRVAIATNYGYGVATGPSVSAILSAVTTALHRVAGIYERELSVSFQLVANNDRLIQTTPVNPYDADPSNAPNTDYDQLVINQQVLDEVIGPDNYDLGHVFTNRTGGLAALESVGDPFNKAYGKSGLTDPLEEIFWQVYVAHEFGHQFGAGHSFNSSQPTRCQNARMPLSAVEPGSGGTIMSYAGTCPPDDYTTTRSVPYFHARSFIEMSTFLTAIAAGTKVSTGNHPPVVFPQSTAVIPNGTAFTLTAAGNDPDGDPLLWTFDQMNQGPGTLLTDPDNGASPMFRFVVPSNSPNRTFPDLDVVLATGTPSPERFPSFVGPVSAPTRSLQFRIVARDGRGGVAHEAAEVTVMTRVGPFRLTAPAGAQNLPGGSPATVRWDVGGTTANGINTSSVNVRFSTDGGFTFPILLASGVPNNGEASVVIPSVLTSTGRLKVEAVGNIFFAVNDASLTVAPQGPTVTPAPTPQPTPTPTIGPTPTPTPFPAGAPRLANVSTRLILGEGESSAIAGFVVLGNTPRRVLVRVMGPSLAAFGVVDPCSNPSLQFFGPQGSIASNDDWRSSQEAEITATGFAPSNDREAAVLAILAPGSYSVVAGGGGQFGVGLVEVYDLDGDAGDSHVANLSTRGLVQTNDRIVIAGFVFRGTVPKRVLIRGVGSTLIAHGIGESLYDPVLTLKDAAGRTIEENQNWGQPNGRAIFATGLAPARWSEAAILRTLPPGAYTALLTGLEGSQGIALVEVYELP